jgi:MSHA biogenesis protein MshP
MRRQRGMSLVVAIFLIVVIALLSAFAVSVGTASTISTNQQLSADRARAAARTGLEWGAYRARVLGICPAFPATALLVLNQVALNGFRVTVTCQRDNAGTVFDITAFAQRGNYGSDNYASHTLVQRFN